MASRKPARRERGADRPPNVRRMHDRLAAVFLILAAIGVVAVVALFISYL